MAKGQQRPVESGFGVMDKRVIDCFSAGMRYDQIHPMNLNLTRGLCPWLAWTERIENNTCQQSAGHPVKTVMPLTERWCRGGVRPKVQSEVISRVNGVGGQRDGDYEGQVQGDIRGVGLRQPVVIKAWSEASAGAPPLCLEPPCLWARFPFVSTSSNLEQSSAGPLSWLRISFP